MSDTANHDPKKKIIWILTIRGFASEINNLIYAFNYAEEKGIDLKVISTYWNFKIKKGLNDYFLFEEYSNSKISFLLFLYKLFFSPLTYFYRKNHFSSLAKQTLEFFLYKNGEKNIIKEDLLSFSFKKLKNILGIKSDLMFEVFHEIRLYNLTQRNLDREAFNLKMNKILLKFWKFNSETSKVIDEIKRKLNLAKIDNYAAFHIRRGDKVAQETMEDRAYEAEEYMQKMEFIAPSIRKIFIMTDDYNVYLEVQKKFPNFNFYTLSNPISKGHDQFAFNNSSAEKKRQLGIDLLTELEIARYSEIFIGSRGSNIFRLVEYFKVKGCYDLSDNSNEL